MTADLFKPPISPDMKVAEFLKHYPELEATLIEMSPAFAKLKNPVLRKTVARVASLGQAALVGNVPVGELINGLRKAAGADADFVASAKPGSMGEKPAWLDGADIAESFDARPVINRGEQPLTAVVGKLNRLESDKVLELIAPFYPAPLIDKARDMGFEVWSEKVSDDLTRIYFIRKTE